MNDEQGLDQQAIDALLSNVSKELPELSLPKTDTTESPAPSEAPSTTDTLVATTSEVQTSPEVQIPPTDLPRKRTFLVVPSILKKYAPPKNLLMVLGLFLVVIASSGFLGYKNSQHAIQSQSPLEKITHQGITFEEKNFVVAAGRGDESIVNAFLDAGMSVDVVRSTDGWSPLISASFYKKTEVVQLLLDKQATINLQDKYGKTALMQATSMGAEDIVKMLLEHGADPNLQDGNGRTALMEAYSKQQAVIAEILKAAGADPAIQPAKAPPTPTAIPPTPKDLTEASSPSSIADATRISVGKAGLVQIGMPIADIKKIYPTVTMSQKYVNGVKKPIATIYINGPNNPSLELELSNSSLKLVSTISTADDHFSTDKQISIKSTVGDIRSQYTISDVRVIDNVIYLSVRSMRMLFELDITNQQALNDWFQTGEASSIPDDIKIKRIVMY